MNISIIFIDGKRYFNPEKWKDGSREHTFLTLFLCHYFPQYHFYLVGKSDFLEYYGSDYKKIFPNLTVVFDPKIQMKKGNNKNIQYQEHVTNWFKENKIKIDFGICLVGSCNAVSTLNTIFQKKNPTKYTTPLNSSYISSYAIDYLNSSNIDYFLGFTDTNYCKEYPRDIFNLPKFHVTQGEIKFKYHEEIITTKRCYLELLHVSSYKLLENFENKSGIACILRCDKFNEKKYDRKKFISDYLNNKSDCTIIGPYLDEYKEQFQNVNFIGKINQAEIQDTLKNFKYSLIDCNKNSKYEITTAKYLEYILSGVLPFHSRDYFVNGKPFYYVDDFLNINSPQEFNEKIDYLENNQNEYNRLIQKIKKIVTKDLLNGKLFVKTLVDMLKETKYNIFNEPNFEKEFCLKDYLMKENNETFEFI